MIYAEQKLTTLLDRVPDILKMSFIAVVVFLVYSNTFHTDFVLDDVRNIQRNPNIQLTSLTPANLIRAGFESPVSSRPVANISFALNYYFHQYRLPGYHLVNLVIHILAGVFLYLFSKATLEILSSQSPPTSSPPRPRQMDLSPSTISFLGTVIWLVHPVQTQSVTYMVQRMNSMAAMFFILSMWLYVKGRLANQSRRRWVWFAGCGLSGVFALGSKEIAATLPLFIVLYEWFFLQDLSQAWLRRFRSYFLGALLVFAALALIYTGADPLKAVLAGYGGRDFTLGQRVMTEFRVVAFYMSLLLFPHPGRLNLDHDISISHSIIDPTTTLVSMLVIIGLIGVAVVTARRERLVSFCILWFFGNLAIESSIIPLELLFEHRSYLPSMLVFLPIIMLLARYVPGQRAIMGTVGVIIAILCLWTYQRNSVWADPITLWQDCVEKVDNNARGHVNLGNALKERGRLEEAIGHYLKAIQIEPGLGKAHYNLGIAYGMKGMHRLAFREISIAKRLTPERQWKKWFRGARRPQGKPFSGHP